MPGLALATVLLLGSCAGEAENKFTDAERDEIADIAGDGSVDPDEFYNLQGRVTAIEERLSM
jgi:hypothetical protein